MIRIDAILVHGPRHGELHRLRVDVRPSGLQLMPPPPGPWPAGMYRAAGIGDRLLDYRLAPSDWLPGVTFYHYRGEGFPAPR